MSKNTGGPAFPIPLTDKQERRWNDAMEALGNPNGMTLRDYFAAKAMPAVYADYLVTARKLGFDEDWELGVAIDAYRMAGAMIKARGDRS